MSHHATRAAPTVRFDETEPLIVSPKTAMRMLSCGETRLYEIIAKKEVDSFKDGGARKILVSSIHAYIERLRNQSEAAEQTPAQRTSTSDQQRPGRTLDSSPVDSLPSYRSTSEADTDAEQRPGRTLDTSRAAG